MELDAARLELGARRATSSTWKAIGWLSVWNVIPNASDSRIWSVRLPVSNSAPGERPYVTGAGRPSTVP